MIMHRQFSFFLLVWPTIKISFLATFNSRQCLCFFKPIRVSDTTKLVSTSSFYPGSIDFQSIRNPIPQFCNCLELSLTDNINLISCRITLYSTLRSPWMLLKIVSCKKLNYIHEICLQQTYIKKYSSYEELL